MMGERRCTRTNHYYCRQDLKAQFFHKTKSVLYLSSMRNRLGALEVALGEAGLALFEAEQTEEPRT